MVNEILPLDGPFVWDKRSRPGLDQFVHAVAPACSDEAWKAVEQVKARGLQRQQIGRSDFALPAFEGVLRRIRDELERGSGFAVLRGLSIDGRDEDDVRTLFWGLCTHLGIPLSQSRNGEFLGEVRDIGVKKGQADSRAYRTGGELRFHMDRCDVLGLLCVRDALSGGLSKAVSSAAVHNEVLRRRPDLMPVLYDHYHFSRQSEHLEGERPWFSGPIYALEQGRFTSQFSLTYVESAQRYPDVPRLTSQQEEAIRLVAAVAEELCTSFRMEPGDIQLLNNHLMYHSRTNYQDHEQFEKKRFLLRIWLATPDSRRLPAERAEAWGSVEPGALRGGVQPPAGPRFAFADWAAAGWSREALTLHD